MSVIGIISYKFMKVPIQDEHKSLNFKDLEIELAQNVQTALYCLKKQY
jgi:hypothetical protein